MLNGIFFRFHLNKYSKFNKFFFIFIKLRIFVPTRRTLSEFGIVIFLPFVASELSSICEQCQSLQCFGKNCVVRESYFVFLIMYQVLQVFNNVWLIDRNSSTYLSEVIIQTYFPSDFVKYVFFRLTMISLFSSQWHLR